MISTISQVHETSAEKLLASAVPPAHQQETAESTINEEEDHPTAKSTSPLKNDLRQPFSVTAEVLDEFKMGPWCFRGIQNIAESTSDESDALWEAYRDVGLMDNHEAILEQCENPAKAVKIKQLAMDKESTLKLLREESEGEEMQRTLKVCYTKCIIIS